ncbi:hypothetical protein AQ436_09280 [Arthrobacter sp. EpRS66]|nr:hypothetical protein AQ436_09280 [Arthrobacter sp. EpRS66]
MPNKYWPLADLKLTTERLELRVPNEEELVALAEIAAKGVHEPGQKPFLTPWTDLPANKRALYVMQQRWGRKSTWKIESWALEFGVFLGSQPVGIATLKAHNFPVLREVKTESWLGLEFHRQGIGTEVRKAILALAFEELGADSALTEVFQDNAGSQGVSRLLGYVHDGISRDVLDGHVVISDRLRLDSSNWILEAETAPVISGLNQARPWFGI